MWHIQKVDNGYRLLGVRNGTPDGAKVLSLDTTIEWLANQGRKDEAVVYKDDMSVFSQVTTVKKFLAWARFNMAYETYLRVCGGEDSPEYRVFTQAFKHLAQVEGWEDDPPLGRLDSKKLQQSVNLIPRY